MSFHCNSCCDDGYDAEVLKICRNCNTLNCKGCSLFCNFCKDYYCTDCVIDCEANDALLLYNYGKTRYKVTIPGYGIRVTDNPREYIEKGFDVRSTTYEYYLCYKCHREKINKNTTTDDEP